jgi:rhodanese-related sulfurtransferase
MKHLLITTLASLILAGNISLLADDKPAAPFVKNVKVEEADKLLHENKKIIILDVRKPDEFAEGHIAGAKNLSFYSADFEKQLSALDKSQTYLVHCAAGGRSAKTRDLMTKLQFQAIYHLDGGLNAWKEAGKPVEK